jgi:hypothetical protein
MITKISFSYCADNEKDRTYFEEESYEYLERQFLRPRGLNTAKLTSSQYRKTNLLISFDTTMNRSRIKVSGRLTESKAVL